jgi:hypothetical protein
MYRVPSDHRGRYSRQRRCIMIIRIMVVDPNDAQRVLVYQMPEHSREEGLFKELLDMAGIEHVTLESNRGNKKCASATLEANTIL